jgi:uncharacterized repeat protein (TIGR01451 family)
LSATCNLTNLSTLFDLQFVCDSRTNGVQVLWSSPLPLAQPIFPADFDTPAPGQFTLKTNRTTFDVPFTIPAGILGSDDMGSYGLALDVMQSAKTEIVTYAVQPPMVQLQPAAGTVLLSWPTNLTGFRLQQSTDLANWMTIASSNANGLGFPSSTGRMFFRLSRPVLDLAVSQQASANPVVAGSNVTYSISVTNRGPADGTGVLVNFTLPATNAIVQSVVASGGAVTQSSGSVLCSLGGLPAGSGTTLTIVVTPLAAGQFLTNASVACNEINEDLGDSMSPSDVTVLPSPSSH